jgi:DNA-binding HxlR family transcriptional regulator
MSRGIFLPIFLVFQGAEVPQRVKYSLRPVINDMEKWGKKYREMVLKGYIQ